MPAIVPRLTTSSQVFVESRPRLPLARGYSEESNIMLNRTHAVLRRFSEPLSFSRTSPQLAADMAQVFEEHGEMGWDGEQAPSISLAMLGKAKTILDRLPASISDPELMVEPDDGSLVLEWWGGYRRLIAVAISANLKLSYIAMIGGTETHGTLPDREDELRQDVVELIKLVTA